MSNTCFVCSFPIDETKHVCTQCRNKIPDEVIEGYKDIINGDLVGFDELDEALDTK